MAVDMMATGGGVALDVMLVVATIGLALVGGEQEDPVLAPVAVGDGPVGVIVLAVESHARGPVAVAMVAAIGAGAEQKDEADGPRERE